jgi:hypothetical protein
MSDAKRLSESRLIERLREGEAREALCKRACGECDAQRLKLDAADALETAVRALRDMEVLSQRSDITCIAAMILVTNIARAALAEIQPTEKG